MRRSCRLVIRDAANGLGTLFVQLACALMLSVPAGAQSGVPLPAEAQVIFNRWMLTTCVGSELPALEADLRRHSMVLAPAFAAALENGPPQAQLDSARAAAVRRFATRAPSLSPGYGVTGVSRQALAKSAQVSQQTFSDDEARRFALGYRSNAVAGLGVLGDTTSRQLLIRLARKTEDPLAAAAREALRRRHPD